MSELEFFLKMNYWKNNNKNGEKAAFIEFHGLKNLMKLTEAQRKPHQLNDCKSGQSNKVKSALHASATEHCVGMNKLCNKLLDSVPISIQSNTTADKQAENVLNLIEPVVQDRFKTTLKVAACKKFKLTPKLTSQEKQKDYHF